MDDVWRWQVFIGRPTTQCWPHSSVTQGSGETPVANFPFGFHNVHKSLILILCSGCMFQSPKSVNVLRSLCMQSKNLLSIFAHWFWWGSPCLGCTWLICTRLWLDPYPAHLTGQNQGPMSVRKLYSRFILTAAVIMGRRDPSSNREIIKTIVVWLSAKGWPACAYVGAQEPCAHFVNLRSQNQKPKHRGW